LATIDKKIGCKAAGRGGMKCFCCGPAPGKDRQAFNRRVKRGKVKEFIRKDVKDQLEKE
jgi:DNA-directed RNA polymerase subunit N (RpoN/RPB10)